MLCLRLSYGHVYVRDMVLVHVCKRRCKSQIHVLQRLVFKYCKTFYIFILFTGEQYNSYCMKEETDMTDYS